MVKLDDDADEKWVYPPHTKTKHDILASYMDGWFPILGTFNGPTTCSTAPDTLPASS